ncbi:MAG: class I SAM-dependent methyltransferase [Planctomycetes bacterium]|nr:class I SAM-dependent methyltransferase [Planctomycetota bacterium]
MGGPSGRAAKERFTGRAAAEKYARSLPGTATDRRERRAIARLLAGLPAGARVLDLPCGTGRLLGFLAGLGFATEAADASPHMAARARAGDGAPIVADAFRTPYRDGAFDAVVCNRLLHHLPEARERRAALAELSRICRGPLVVSFFRDFGWDALVFRLRTLLTRRRPRDRIPIRLAALRADAVAAGLRVASVRGARPLVSKQYYASLRREPDATIRSSPG